MTTKVKEWSELPRLRDGHPSTEYRRGRPIPFSQDKYGNYDWEMVAVPCGEWYNGGTVLCDEHVARYQADYPQGWRFYPGDVCPHGMYTGGSGVDWMCGACESGE